MSDTLLTWLGQPQGRLMLPRSTYTYAFLELSDDAYAEIRSKMLAAGYGDMMDTRREDSPVDMCGIAVVPEGYESE